MSSLPKRLIAVALLLSLVVAACGNSGDDSDDAATTTSADDSSTTEPGDADRDKFVKLTGVPGVTDDTITYSVIGTKANNPLGTCILDCYVDGIEAYFAYRNDEGGIFGRDLKLATPLDDELTQNQVRALDVIAKEDSFGNFNATLFASGWGDLDKAKVPTYVWGIHAEEAANRSHIFPSAIIRCGDCIGRSVPWVAKEAGATKAGLLGYGTSENSKVCTQTLVAAIEKYQDDTGVTVGYSKDDLAFGLANGIGPEVTAMKNAGVDFIATCMDLNGMKEIASELRRQDMDDVVLYHPNTYNQQFVKEAGTLFEGDYVLAQFRPFEADVKGTGVEKFLEWIDKTGSEPSEIAMVGWINASLAFESLLAAGPEFDRDKVSAAVNAMTAFDAEDSIEPQDWTTAHEPYTEATRSVDKSDECSSVVKVVNGEFEVVAGPKTPWLCWSGADLSWAEPEPTSFR